MICIDKPMPKCCGECFALDEHGDYPFCLISQDQRGYTFNTRLQRMPSCPLKAQETKHGQWITDGDHMICSVCENIPFNQVKLNDKMIYNMDIGNMMKYCPICGARMDGDADGTH